MEQPKPEEESIIGKWAEKSLDLEKGWKSSGDIELFKICKQENYIGGLGRCQLYQDSESKMFVRRDWDSNWEKIWEVSIEEAQEFFQEYEDKKAKMRENSSEQHVKDWGLEAKESPFK